MMKSAPTLDGLPDVERSEQFLNLDEYDLDELMEIHKNMQKQIEVRMVAVRKRIVRPPRPVMCYSTSIEGALDQCFAHYQAILSESADTSTGLSRFVIPKNPVPILPSQDSKNDILLSIEKLKKQIEEGEAKIQLAKKAKSDLEAEIAKFE
jgi:hypothetical protein